MAAFVPNTYLVYVDAKRTPLSNCANQPVWRFFFATNKDSYYRARPVAGYVEYAPKPVSSGDCERSERVVVDTALAPVMGYIPLAKHQNLDTVQVTWQEALNQVAAARPGFVWDGNMEIFTPVYPGLEDSVYYVYFGAINQRRTQVLVDATTGDVVP